ncbi:TetR/AcrR family transcriptional regulator [Streptomyces sp. NPDC005374]|uniref:TetR/AcrR family transcriptional regulator n=1 Tax=Streptomyces sp. NPDC005374 TaxID=3364713 RepID=UPI00368B8B74
MSEARRSSGRQRPTATRGPVRDAARDARIIAAALDLLAEGGYAALTMEKAAVRAGVGKATVYRRWSSREDLAADAVETLGFAAGPDQEAPHPTTLRDDLVRTLVITSGCTDGNRHRLVAVLLETSRSHAELTAALRERFVAGQRAGISGCLERAMTRGEITDSRVERLLEPGRLELAAAITLLVHLPSLEDRPLGAEGVARIVDQVLMPLITGSSNT